MCSYSREYKGETSCFQDKTLNNENRHGRSICGEKINSRHDLILKGAQSKGVKMLHK